MTNSRFRCAGCRLYFRMADVGRSNGVNRFCESCSNGRSTRTPSSARSSFTAKPRKPNTRSEPTDATCLAVSLRDGARCRRCGSPRNLHRHHIRYRSEFGRRQVDHSELNLITLCAECHDVIHSNKNYWQSVCLAYIWLRYTEGPLYLKEAERRVSAVSPVPSVPEERSRGRVR